MFSCRQFIRTHIALILIISIYIIYFSILTIWRDHSFYSAEFDLGNMMQTLWNTIHGHFFMESDPTGKAQVISRFADHADVGLVILASFYALFPTSTTLLITQSIIVGLGAIPIYLLTLLWTKNKKYALFFATLYLLSPGIEAANVFEFHMITLGATFLLFSFYFLYIKKYIFALPFIILALLSKEEVGFVMFMMGVYFLFSFYFEYRKKYTLKHISLKTYIHEHKRDIAYLLLISLVSFIYSCILIAYIIPYFRQGPSIYLAQYRGNNDGISGIIFTIMAHPIKSLTFNWHPKLRYVTELFAPTSFIAFISPLALLICIPELLIDILSTNVAMQSIHYHYAAIIEPFIMIATILGFIQLNIWIPRIWKAYKPQYLLLFLLASTLACGYIYGPLFFSREFTIYTQLPTQDQKEIQILQQTIPLNATVTASNNLGPSFANRYAIYVFPTGVGSSDYLIIEASVAPTTPPGYKEIYAGVNVFAYQKTLQRVY